MNKAQREKWADKLFDIGVYITGIHLVGIIFQPGPVSKYLYYIVPTMILLAYYCFYAGHYLLSKEE